MDKTPRTNRGRNTQRKLLDAAAVEFGEKGFHAASISSITRRAEVALGTFYTYFESKDALFQALVQHMSNQVKSGAATAIAELKDTGHPSALDIEEAALASFLRFASEHKEIYRIIDESEFVDPAAYRAHYESTAERILERLQEGAARGELRTDIEEAYAWALMGMYVFLGLRFAVWADDMDEEKLASVARSILENGITKPAKNLQGIGK
ncbi:TetR/AcrR family transcriptional regulator [Aurantiacibacter poecillastricola]|uniref:TetR/AcrR family transcriptional regulator n=1 Tax=Aurantiacibacter poecillastricola TaxID=3064385 RepID=UPI00273EA988|nr:TetR/AcrR family transcriptional regulator [Aurantiacibacter sp. 219JJ12-13]MDP5263514.1 TetR/AcrR family transcriptional regulator [Aurantiacibacter sp. 219JJ12-13]